MSGMEGGGLEAGEGLEKEASKPPCGPPGMPPPAPPIGPPMPGCCCCCCCIPPPPPMPSNTGSATVVYCFSPSSLTGSPFCASAMRRSATAQFSLSSAFLLCRSASVQMPASIFLSTLEREKRPLTAPPVTEPVPCGSHSWNSCVYNCASCGLICSSASVTLAGPVTGGIVWEGPPPPPMGAREGRPGPPRGGRPPPPIMPGPPGPMPKPPGPPPMPPMPGPPIMPPPMPPPIGPPMPMGGPPKPC